MYGEIVYSFESKIKAEEYRKREVFQCRGREKTVDNQKEANLWRGPRWEKRSLSALCRKYGISRQPATSGSRRYKGGEMMLDRPHTPFREAFQNQSGCGAADRGCWAAHPTWGARKIQRFWWTRVKIPFRQPAPLRHPQKEWVHQRAGLEQHAVETLRA